mmetsp:Transcript_123655/g.276194  ORF Transcript_123655/g.276194 Transcript_123655/m.276194 type:complete len:545 (-) Transcript_123655:755-2389(-)
MGLDLRALALVRVDALVHLLVLHNGEVRGDLQERDIGNERLLLAVVSHLDEVPVRAEVVKGTDQEVARRRDLQRPGVDLLPSHADLGGINGIPLQGNVEHIPIVALGDLPLLALAILVEAYLAGSISHLSVVYVRVDALQCIPISVHGELQHHGCLLHLEAVIPTRLVRVELYRIPARPRAADEVLPCVLHQPVSAGSLLPRELLHIVPPKSDDVLITGLAGVVIREIVASDAVDAPVLRLGRPLMRADARHILPRPLEGRIDLFLEVPVLDQEKLFPLVHTKGDLDGIAPVCILLHVLSLLHAIPSPDNLIGVLLTVLLHRELTEHRRDLLDNHIHLSRKSLRPGFRGDRRIAADLIPVFVVGHLELERLPLILCRNDERLLQILRLRCSPVSVFGQVAKLLAHAPVLGLVVMKDLVVHLGFLLLGVLSSLHASTVEEAAAPGIDLHEVVRVQVIRLVANAALLTSTWPEVELHPHLDIERVDVGMSRLVDRVPVKLHLPDREGIHPRQVVVTKLIHRAGAPGAIGEHDENLPERSVPLSHRD